MAKKSRKSSSRFLSIPFLLGALFILVVSGILAMNALDNDDVKGVKDFRPFANLKKDATKSAKVRQCVKDSRITSFSLEGTCENRDKDAFTKASYTCQDATTGTIEKGCLGAAALLAQAKVACARTICPKPSPTSVPTTQ